MSVSSLPVIRDEGGIAYIRWLSTTRSDFYPPAASAKDIEEQAYGLAFTVEEMVHLLSTRSISPPQGRISASSSRQCRLDSHRVNPGFF